MKKTTLFAAIALSVFIWTGCQNNSKTQDNAAGLEQTRGTQQVAEEAAPQTAKKVLLARKWTNGDQFVDVKLEGAFTANLGSGEFAGTWELNEENGALVFNGEKAADGKGHAEKMSFTLKDISDSQLTLVDAAGKETVFSAQ